MWTKNGVIITDTDMAAGLKDLIFTAAKIRHSGMYTCSASNIYGTISQSVFIKVVAGTCMVNAYNIMQWRYSLSPGQYPNINIYNILLTIINIILSWENLFEHLHFI